MKKYYFHDGTAQHGPFTLDELRAYRVTPQTMVWFDSLPQWKPAGEVEELKALFSTTTIPSPVTQTDWNNVDFFFMDGAGVQLGPFKLNQLAGRNITAQTHVWYDPLPKWTTAGEVPALKSFIGSAPTTVVSSSPAQAPQTDWNNIDFYFMDGAGVQQGPFKLNQLAGRNISAHTAVWYDPLPKWTTAGEVPALKSIIGSAPATVVSSSPAQAPQTDWNNIEFYFMDSAGVQQGPFKLNQLAGRNITTQTHVWYDPLPKWTTAGEIPALKSVIGSAATTVVSSTTTQTQTDWNNKDFYFMGSGGTQQGPFKLQQLIGKNITAQTQVWYDPLPKWTTAGEVPALKSIIENTGTASSNVASSTTVHTEDWTKKQFFFVDSSGAQQGPLTLKQLEEKNITAETEVWYDPLPNWTTAGEVAPLKSIVEAAKARAEEWNNKFYFITDASGTRQGPFKLQQLKEKSITAQTPIWYDPLTEWTTAGEVAALKDIIAN